MMERFDLRGKKILEVGYGKGEFLRVWKDYDVRAVAIEYDKDLVIKARQEGLEVYKAYSDNGDTEIPDTLEQIDDRFYTMRFPIHRRNAGLLKSA